MSDFEVKITLLNNLINNCTIRININCTYIVYYIRTNKNPISIL